MTDDEYLRRVPKVELHCHFEGTVRPATFADLARKHGIRLAAADPERLYDYTSIYEFLGIFAQVSSTLIDRDDFARTAFESIEDGVRSGNIKYREMFFNPTLHTRRGVSYPTVVDGLIDGIRRAVCYFSDDLTEHPIVEMEKAGLGITLNSDDPPMFHTDIGEEFARMVPAAGWDAARVRNLCLTAVDAS
ncbi:MAG TPA: hypothetical protein VG365_13710 [Solirubrobacteraceae bacterium]|nr:hypothetical protein [Solirubrobacteraceae bacterium]